VTNYNFQGGKMIYGISLVMVAIVVRFFVKNRYFFSMDLKKALSTYSCKSISEKNTDIFFGVIFLMASVTVANFGF
jgi:hypothetical protein